ncbi:MAG: winged helix-turn-helix domain-containing protein [Zavarzinella sp.]
MPIPDYQSIMLPLLRLTSDGNTHSFRSTIDKLAEEYSLTTEERNELLPSGKQPTFDNRVGWARTYMTKAGLLFAPKKGLIQITPRGTQVLNQNPTLINVPFLEQFDEFIAFRTFSVVELTISTGGDSTLFSILPLQLKLRIPQQGLAQTCKFARIRRRWPD